MHLEKYPSSCGQSPCVTVHRNHQVVSTNMATSTRWLSWDSGRQTGPLPPFHTSPHKQHKSRMNEALTCPAGCHPRTLAQTIISLVWELRASGGRQVIRGPGSPLANRPVGQTPPCLLMGAVIDRLRRVKCQGSWKVAWSSRRLMWHLPRWWAHASYYLPRNPTSTPASFLRCCGCPCWKHSAAAQAAPILLWFIQNMTIWYASLAGGLWSLLSG